MMERTMMAHLQHGPTPFLGSKGFSPTFFRLGCHRAEYAASGPTRKAPMPAEHAAMKTTSDRRATAELLAALVEIAIAHGRRHYSQGGEPLATTLAVLECLQREGFVTVEELGTPYILPDWRSRA